MKKAAVTLGVQGQEGAGADSSKLCTKGAGVALASAPWSGHRFVLGRPQGMGICSPVTVLGQVS